ncbi:acyl-CoA carboxylase subunit epsilon [Streptomyces sp. NPDC047525]|uniref:acyl-CoA carboxylase subunit epsilon n=1 Tax=Streptomyces sp. NPDC047525 TaxID=3155264 RepID=UPI0033FA4BB2
MTGTRNTALTVVRGRPDDLELAAVTAVLRAVARQTAQQADVPAPPVPDPAHARWEGSSRTRPAGSWRSAGRHRPGPAGRARATA